MYFPSEDVAIFTTSIYESDLQNQMAGIAHELRHRVQTKQRYSLMLYPDIFVDEGVIDSESFKLIRCIVSCYPPPQRMVETDAYTVSRIFEQLYDLEGSIVLDPELTNDLMRVNDATSLDVAALLKRAYGTELGRKSPRVITGIPPQLISFFDRAASLFSSQRYLRK